MLLLPLLPQGTLVKLRANQPSFREVSFAAGFNVIVAERTQESTKKDSRNGLGKSTLIEIISFCLGSSIEKKGLGAEALNDWAFTLDMNLNGRPISVTRETATAAKVFVEGDTTGWPILPVKEKKSGRLAFKAGDWIGLLGALMFGLPAGGFDTDYSPKFRALIAYFIRRGKDAYSIPAVQT